jgi:N-acetyl-gamma-glutamyl-phosphate reductase
MRAAVLGSTGYAGMMLLRLLGTHPDIDRIVAASSSKAGTPIAEADPGLSSATLAKAGGEDAQFAGVEEAEAARPDVVFAALPHLTSAEVLDPFYDSAVVIDLSADYRLPDAELFRHAYGSAPPRPDRLDGAVYGLPEWYREEIRHADIIANPGCYPTAVLLPLLPLARERLIGERLVVNALSGISGAGKKAKEHLLFGERSENVNAYAPGHEHRHWAEVYHYLRSEGLYQAPQPAPAPAGETGAASLADAYGRVPLLFTPHLVPIKQGIAVTTAARVSDASSEFTSRDEQSGVAPKIWEALRQLRR